MPSHAVVHIHIPKSGLPSPPKGKPSTVYIWLSWYPGTGDEHTMIPVALGGGIPGTPIKGDNALTAATKISNEVKARDSDAKKKDPNAVAAWNK